jgi:hypothetical protein
MNPDLLDILTLAASDIASELTLEQRLRLARLLRLRAVIEDDDGAELLDAIAGAFELHGLSMDTADPDAL